MQLSALLGRPLATGSAGERVGRVDDVIVRLRGGDYPLVKGLVVKLGGRRLFLNSDKVVDLESDPVVLRKPRVDPREFERREGEVLLREDILGHRLIDVPDVELVRAWDVELEQKDEGWVLSCVDTRRPPRMLGLLRRAPAEAGGCQDWLDFEPLIGHASSADSRRSFGRVRRLKPAQIADLLEDASRDEGHEILDTVHGDPELEADVFEELDPDLATKLFADKTDDEIAGVLDHMRADDAADALMDLPQARREPVLDLLPIGKRTKVLALLGFNPESAGGLMNPEFLGGSPQTPAGDVLRGLARGETLQPEALVSFHALDPDGRLVGVVSLVSLLRAEPGAPVEELLDRDPVRVGPEADAVDVALLMADFNLLTLPVVDGEAHMLGVITVDDVLEATIPDDWRRREPPPRPEPLAGTPASSSEAQD